jgi:CRP-like cAMP-binding protein
LVVRRAALLAAGRIKHPGLWPAVIEALAIRRLRRAATLALVAGGESVVPALTAAFEGAGQQRELQIGVARVCGQLCSERAVAFLQDKIEFPDSAVRSAMLEALSACGYRAPGPVVARVHEQIKTEAAQAAAILADRTEFDDGAQIALLAEILDDQFAQARRRIFFLLTMVYDARAILRVRDALAAGSATQHAYGLELLDTLLPREMKVYLLPLLDELTLEERLQRLSVSFPQARLSREQILHGLITVTAVQHEPWIAASALFTAGQVGVASCRAPATAALRSPHPLVRETAHWTLARLDGRHDEQSEGKGQSRMLSTLEKVLILKGVHIFAETPAEVVADVATIVTEVEIAAGETLFEKGERGDSMYVIVSGKVRVHDGSRTVAELGERQVFGEMALLDPEPRSASVTALEDTQLFRVEAEPFFELIDDRPEVARGIIRVLTGYVRARMRELAALDTRLQEVERDGQKSGERPSAPHLEERLPGARPRTARRPARVDWPARRRHSRG